MLLVPTYLAPSKISGIGLFAKDFISAGTKIWKFHPGLDLLIDEKVFESYKGEAFYEDLQKYSYKSPVSGFYIWCSDNGKFMNHSEDPNCLDGPGDFDLTVARRDIQAGEEITCDYRSFFSSSQLEKIEFLKKK